MKKNFINLQSCAVFLCGIALILFYLIPNSICSIRFSPHVIPVIAGTILLVINKPYRILRNENLYGLTFIGIFLLSILFSPSSPVADIWRAWLISLASFLLFRSSFSSIPKKLFSFGAQVFLAIWSLAAISQVLFGKIAYITGWYGLYPKTIYATGLSTSSNQCGILIVSLLVWTLVINLHKTNWRRFVLWLMGCSALYFTLSRAGWFALFFAIILLLFRLRKNHRKIRMLALHVIIALLAFLLSWSIPSNVDIYEPLGIQSAARWDLSNNGGDYSRETRLMTLRVALMAATEYPFTGVGLGNFPNYYSSHRTEHLSDNPIDPRDKMTTHNGYAQVMAESGIPTLLFLLLWFASLLRQGYKNRAPEAIAIHASIVGIMVWLLFHDGMYDRQLWILLGCSAALRIKQIPPRHCC